MIVSTRVSYSDEQIKRVSEQFEVYIKTVIDVKQKICIAGMDRHFEGEQILLKNGSKQTDLWGGGIDLETKEIDFNSFINIRPRDNNTKNEIQSEVIKKEFKKLTEYFFKELYE